MAHRYNILSTAFLPENALEHLAQAKLLCDAIPFIQTKAALTDAIITQIKTYVAEKHIVIFTSAQAVEAVISCCDGRIPDWRFFCISGATKKAVADFWGEDRIMSAAADAIELAKYIDTIPPQEMIFFCGNKRLDTLPTLLSGKGFQVKECVVYETKLTPAKVNKAYDAILFFSPSGVESYMSLNTIEPGTTLFAIGKTTAQSLRQIAANKIIIAAQPDKNILVNIVIEFYKNR